MSLPLLGLALDRTPLLPLQLMNGVLPLLQVLQVSNLLSWAIMCTKCTCRVTLHQHDQVVLIVALHFCCLYTR